jgi:RHS repeat-associated protein
MSIQRLGTLLPKKLCASILVLFLFELSRAGSDPSQPTGSDATGVFGEAAQYPHPDPVTGAMGYSVPFELPAARGQAQPQLGLTYSSSASDREAGYGWGIDLPSIERHPLSGWPKYIDNGKAADEDRYAYSGQSLVFVCVIGAASCPAGGGPMPPWATGWRSYRLQVEGMFSRFFLSPDRRTWRVQQKGGELLEIGVPLVDPGLAPAATEMGDAGKIFRWRIVRDTDVHGNLVVYVWKTLGLRGLLYPTDIYDTPPTVGGARSLDAFAHHTQLSWDAPGFAVSRYARIDKAHPDMRLSRVAVASMPWSGAAPRQVVRIYHLRYFNQRGPVAYDFANDAPLWHHSFLRSVQLEGKCASAESGGQVSPATQCVLFPPTSFQYQTGELQRKGGVFSSQTHGTPPGEDETNFKVLEFVESAAVVDLNRDGLPDLVQAWPEGAFVDMRNFPDDFRRRSAYINTGDKQLLQLQWTHQCMDMGALAAHNQGKGAAFLTNKFAASVLGAWGDSLLLWSLVDYGQITARKVEATADFCSMAGVDPNHGAWAWGGGDEVGWSRHVDFAPSQHSRNRWFADVDGDGLPDSFGRTQGAGGDLERATVFFTKRFSKAEHSQGAAMIPFTSNTDLGVSLTPAESPRSDTRFFYVDVNGDGLTDLVTYNPGDGGGIPRVRPGDGRGRFACDPAREPASCFTPVPGAPVWVSDVFAIDVPDAKKPWPFTDDTYIHDVTGDGLADIIQYEPGHDSTQSIVRLWINQDGHTFRCATPTNVNPCQVNSFFDDLHATFTIDPHRVTFADMDGNGVDDMVVLGRSGAWASSVFNSPSAVTPRAPRPGQLIRIENGLGLTSLIDYRTVQELDVEAASNGEPWELHAPQVVSVVSRIRMLDTKSATGTASVPEPYRIERTTNYSYRDPVYDEWSRAFLGFRKVRTREGFDQSVTETTYWFGPCQRGLKPCPQSSDDEEWKALIGKPVRVDRFVPAFLRHQQAEKLLSTTLYEYSNDTLFSNLQDRSVRYSYADRVDTYLYDTSAPVVPGEVFHITTNGDDLIGPSSQQVREHLEQTYTMDRNGNLVKFTDEGRPNETNLNPGRDGRYTSTAEVHCTRDWQCLTDKVTITSDPVSGAARKSRYTYDAFGQMTMAERELTGVEPLTRFHETPGAPIAPAPVAASTPGWKRMATLDYDTFGNITRIVGPGAIPSCQTIRYDAPFSQFPEVTETRRNGCASSSVITVTREFDRGFGAVVTERSPNGGLTENKLDDFGRIVSVTWPQPDAAPLTSVPAMTFRYHDQSPLSWVAISRNTGTGPNLESIDVYNGLGEKVFGFDRADPSAGDLGNWVLRGWVERDSVGRTRRVYRPSFFTGDPASIAATAQTVAPPAAAGRFDYSYDEFGRTTFIADAGVLVAKYQYMPLVSDLFDAEQLKPSGPRSGQHTRLIQDGHGRPVTTISFIKGDQIRTSAVYLPTGEPTLISQSHTAGAETITRTLTYDSLGRIQSNVEPNSTTQATVGAPARLWRYAWDDAGRLVGSSDARGCGENLFYDGVGRLVAEDYSPCRATQAAYTPPDLATGDGTEMFYRYDEYEAGQLRPVPGFADAAPLATGRLTSIQDRGAHTRFNYDNRGRLRRITRNIAPPGPTAPILQNRYTPHTYETRIDYDLADRMTTRSTGVDVPELLVAGASAESYAYTARGLLRQIASTYGVLLKDPRFDADGLVREYAYGDAATTKVTFGYDPRRRLASYTVGRSAPAVWSAATPTYPVPGADTKQLQLMDLTYKYDDAGNLLQVADASPPSAWPAGIKPVQRDVAYDDLYRVARIDYATGLDSQVSPYAEEEGRSDRRAVPVRGSRRVRFQSFAYDWKGNTTSTEDDRTLRYDRSVGTVINGEPEGKPNQLKSAGPGIRAQYDASGNLADLAVERTGCPGTPVSPCTHRFVYEWDEINELSRAARWDYPGGPIPASEPVYPLIPTAAPAWDLHYTYSLGDRAVKTAKNPLGDERHTLSIFDTLRVNDAKFRGGDYEQKPEITAAYLGGIARVVYDTGLPSPSADPKHVFLAIGDDLGSTSAVIDLKSGELTERTQFQGYGAVESDFRPKRWSSFREPYKFTGKEEDMEAGVTYFGARYYQAHIGRWMSPDPIAVHAFGGDHNPYAYVHGRVMTMTDPLGLEEKDAPPVADCPSGAVCPGGTSYTPDKAPAPAPAPAPGGSAPSPPAPADPPTPGPAPSGGAGAPAGAPSGDTGGASGTLARLENKVAGVIAKVENTRIGFKGSLPHFVIGNVHRATWNEAVNAIGPAAWIYGEDKLRMAVPGDAGDVSEAMAVLAALIISHQAGGSSGGAKSLGPRVIAGYELIAGASRVGNKLTLRILYLANKTGPGTGKGMRVLFGAIIKGARIMGVEELVLEHVGPNDDMRAIIANSTMWSELGFVIKQGAGHVIVMVRDLR